MSVIHGPVAIVLLSLGALLIIYGVVSLRNAEEVFERARHDNVGKPKKQQDMRGWSLRSARRYGWARILSGCALVAIGLAGWLGPHTR